MTPTESKSCEGGKLGQPSSSNKLLLNHMWFYRTSNNTQQKVENEHTFQWEIKRALYLFPRTAVTNYYKLGGVNSRSLLCYNSGGWKSKMRCQQVWFLLRDVKEGTTPGLCPWPVSPCVSLCLPSIYVCIQIFSSYKCTSPMGLAPI